MSRVRWDADGRPARGLARRIWHALEVYGPMSPAALADEIGAGVRSIRSSAINMIADGRLATDGRSGGHGTRYSILAPLDEETEAAWRDAPRICPRADGDLVAPCPWISCRYHLWIDQPVPRPDPLTMAQPCAISWIVERQREPATLEEVAVPMGDVSREWIRRVEDQALHWLSQHADATVLRELAHHMAGVDDTRDAARIGDDGEG